MNAFARLPLLSLAAMAVVLVSGCAKKEAAVTRDIGPEAEAYYKAHADVFHFATPADLPKDLVWNDGRDVPEFASPDAKRGGTFHFWIPDFPRTLRAVGPDATQSFRAWHDDIAMSLLGSQPNTDQDTPGLAKAWAFGSDHRTMYFKLDPDARYSDGVPIKADDYFFDIFFLRSRYINDPFTSNYVSEHLTGLTKYDDYTISATWRDPKPDLDSLLGGLSPAPEHFYKDLGDDYVQRYQWMMEPTPGPYIIKPEDLHKGSYVDFTRLPDWWANNKRFYRHRYNPDCIRLEVIRDTDKVFESFKRGDLDLFDKMTLTKYWHDKLPDSDPLVQKGYIHKTVFYNQAAVPTWGLCINTTMPLLNNRDIREGIAYASNFDLVDQKYFRGDYVRMQTGSDGYPEVPFPNIHPRPYSVEKALEHFAKAGFTQRGSDGILVDAKGQRLSFTLTCPYERMSDVLTILRQEAAKAGLELNLEVLDQTTAYKKIDEKHHQIAFSAFMAGGRYPEYRQLYYSTYADKPQNNNLTNTADPEMDKLIDTYDKAQTMDEIRRLAQQIEQRVYENAAFIPAFKQPFDRSAYWRWVKWPTGFNVRTSITEYAYLGGLFWIDDDTKKETLEARDRGNTFPPEIKVYDQWKTADK